MDKLKLLVNLVQQQSSLGLGLVSLLTAGGEQVFSSVLFRCPCNQLNFLYGLVFLLVPALALLLLGYTLSKRMWRLVTGLSRRRRRRQWRLCAHLKVFFHITTMVLVAPSSWIAVALLNGNYFECAMSGTNVSFYEEHLCAGKNARCQTELHEFPCRTPGAVPQADREYVLLTLRAESQVLGWLLIACIMLSSLLLSCTTRCSSPISYLQLKFWRLYVHEENVLMESYTENHAKELARRNLESFFKQTEPEHMVTPSCEDWEKISSLYRFSTRDHYYSMLHRYVETCQDSTTMKMASVRSTGSAHCPAALSFVDEGRVLP